MKKKSKQPYEDKLSHTCTPMKEHSGARGSAPFPPFFQFFFRLHWQHRPSPFRTHILLVKSHPRCFFWSLSFLLVTCVGILICCVWTCQSAAGLTVEEDHNGHRCLGYTNTFCIKNLRFVCNKANVLLSSLFFLHRLWFLQHFLLTKHRWTCFWWYHDSINSFLYLQKKLRKLYKKTLEPS